MGQTVLERAVRLAKKRGILRDEFAETVVQVSGTTLWRAMRRGRPLSQHEMARVRAYIVRPAPEEG